jgi:transposase InsO family protein
MVQCSPSLQTFAATAKSVDRQTHTPRTKCAFGHAYAQKRADLVTLAHQSRLSLGSEGRPRMTEGLKEIGLDIGHRGIGCLMREKGRSMIRTRKHKVTTDSNHKFNIAPNLLDRNFSADGQNHNPDEFCTRLG